MTHWAARYVGIPFAETGFDFNGCHCWGLVVLAYQSIGVDLPRFDTLTAEQLAGTAKTFRASSERAPWWPVLDARRDFDVILMGVDEQSGGRLRRFPAHIGIAVGADRVLHVERGTGATCIPADHPSIRDRIMGAWRHEVFR